MIPADHVTTEAGAIAKTSSTSNELDERCSKDFSENMEFWILFVFFSIPLYLPNSSLHDFLQRCVHLQSTRPPSIACSGHICWWDESNVCHRHCLQRTWNSDKPPKSEEGMNKFWVTNDNESLSFLVKISGMPRFVVSNIASHSDHPSFRIW